MKITTSKIVKRGSADWLRFFYSNKHRIKQIFVFAFILWVCFIAVGTAVASAGDYWSRKNNKVVQYGTSRRFSTSGEMRFDYYDIRNNKWTFNPKRPWFWASTAFEDDASIANFVDFMYKYDDYIFKIIGTRNEDDCDYYSEESGFYGACLGNITIEKIIAVKRIKNK